MDEPTASSPTGTNPQEYDFLELENKVVNGLDEIKIYHFVNGKAVESGILSTNQKVLLAKMSEIDEQYLQIDGTSYYLNGVDCIESSSRVQDSHLVPFNESVLTKTSYTLYDEKNREVITLKNQDSYPIYVKEEDKVGLLFNHRILYLFQNEIESVTEQVNYSDELADEIPVLMYHFFYSEENNEQRKDGNYVEVKEFQEQLQSLQSKHWISLTMKELELVLKEKAHVPKRSFVITIDDGDPSVYQYAYPILKESGYNATLFLICGWLGEKLPWEFIEMRENGIESQSHGFLMHQSGCPGQGHSGRLLCVDEETGIADTIQSLEYVDGGFVYCYPFGDVNEQAIKILKQSGVQLAFTTEYGKVSAGNDLYRLPRIRVTGGAGIERFMKSLN